jgi:hypothetical protein
MQFVTILFLVGFGIIVILLIRMNSKLRSLSLWVNNVSNESFKIKMGLRDTEKRIIEINRKVEPLEWKLLSDEDREQYIKFSHQQNTLNAIASSYEEVFRELEDELSPDELKSMDEREEVLWRYEKERRAREGGREEWPDFELKKAIEKMSTGEEFWNYVQNREFSPSGNSITWQQTLQYVDVKRINETMGDIYFMYKRLRALQQERAEGRK